MRSIRLLYVLSKAGRARCWCRCFPSFPSFPSHPFQFQSARYGSVSVSLHSVVSSGRASFGLERFETLSSTPPTPTSQVPESKRRRLVLVSVSPPVCVVSCCHFPVVSPDINSAPPDHPKTFFPIARTRLIDAPPQVSFFSLFFFHASEIPPKILTGLCTFFTRYNNVSEKFPFPIVRPFGVLFAAVCTRGNFKSPLVLVK